MFSDVDCEMEWLDVSLVDLDEKGEKPEENREICEPLCL